MPDFTVESTWHYKRAIYYQAVKNTTLANNNFCAATPEPSIRPECNPDITFDIDYLGTEGINNTNLG